jgi:hypothetical protein
VKIGEICEKYNPQSLNFPVKDVVFCKVETPYRIADPMFSDGFVDVSPQECSIQLEGVGHFYIKDGERIEMSPAEGVDPGWVDWALNGHVLVALLHQRRILNFHASSLIYNNRGIMILGQTGAGKSSLTAALSLHGAGFLSDDLTPVVFKGGQPLIWPLYRQIKLCRSTLDQLKVDSGLLNEDEQGTGKYILSSGRAEVDRFPLHTILHLEIGDDPEIRFQALQSGERFALLRSGICLWEMLRGMPETEAAYLQQLIVIVEQAKIVRVSRPPTVAIAELYEAVRGFLGER